MSIYAGNRLKEGENQGEKFTGQIYRIESVSIKDLRQ